MLLSISAYVLPFVSPIISAGVAFSILWINSLRDKNKASEGDEKTWRDGRLAAEKALSERITAEEKARVKWELENAGDVAHIVGLLKELGETQRLLSGIATTSQHHSTDIANLHTRQNDLQNQINQFLISHAKSS